MKVNKDKFLFSLWLSNVFKYNTAVLSNDRYIILYYIITVSCKFVKFFLPKKKKFL